MKRSWIFLLAFLGLWACKKQSDPDFSCIITGTVSSVEKEYLTFTFEEFLDSVKIDQNGNFELDVTVREKGNGFLLYNNSLVEIYLEPGKELDLSIDSRSFPEKIVYKGSLGPMNHYMQLSRKLDKQTDISSENLFRMEPEAFLIFSDSVRLTKAKLLQEYVDKYPEIDTAFARKKAAEILYTWANQQLLYPGYHTIVTNKIPELPDDYHNIYLDKLELENDNLMISQAYLTFLENYLDYKEAVYLETHPEIKKIWFPGSVSRFRVIHEEFSNPDIKDYLLYKSMSEHLDDFGTEHVESFITNFRTTCTNEEYKALIEEKFRGNEKLARGMEAPELEFIDRNREKIKLSELKGNLLYINFWASWSALSIQEFSHWEQLRKNFDGFEVEFISVSMDFANDRNKWEYILDNQNLGGLHLMQDTKSTSYTENYFINDLPRYLLIDKEGKIISAYAPRPSENMEFVLKSLLKE